MKHTRKCRGCGNVAEHSDNIAPEVCCKKCGSQDTRKMKHSIHCAGYRGHGQGFDCGACDCRYTLGARDIKRERDACADAMEQEHVRCLALEAALRLIVAHENTDVAKLALNPRMACRRCGAAAECDVAFDLYNLGTQPKVDCLATK